MCLHVCGVCMRIYQLCIGIAGSNVAYLFIRTQLLKQQQKRANALGNPSEPTEVLFQVTLSSVHAY